MKGNFPQYPEYNALSDYHRRCLVATNYWAVIAGEKPVPVPPEDKYYYNYFDPRCFEIRKQAVADLMGGKKAPKAPAPVAEERKPTPRDPALCANHAPIPDGKGGFKCERCGTELKSKQMPAPPERPAIPGKAVARQSEKPKQKLEPKSKEQGELF